MATAGTAEGTLSTAQRAALDDPQLWDRHTRWLDEGVGPAEPRRARSLLSVQGMYCAACAPTLEQVLRQVPGVRAATVLAGSQRAQVDWIEGQTAPSALIEAIRAAGYDAHPAQTASAQEARVREQRAMMWRLFVALFCMMQVMMYATPGYVAAPGQIDEQSLRLLNWAGWLLSLPVVVFSARPFFEGAWRDLRARRIGMDVPVSLGIGVTFVASMGATFDPQGLFGGEVWYDSLTMFVAFLLTGRWLELRARGRTLGALEALTQRMPQSVERIGSEGRCEWVAPFQLRAGDEVRVRAGQAFPADGTVLQGQAQVDEALLTGESRPLRRGPGEPVLAGSHNLAGPVHIRVDHVGDATRYAQIVRLMEAAARTRPALARLADRIAGPFLGLVLLLALGGAIGWALVDPSRSVAIAVAVLIVTCPCALALATPAAVLSATGALARRGILVQRLDAIEALARVDTVMFDKTGTLTKDRLQLASVEACAEPLDPGQRQRAAGLARASLHPVSQALAQALSDEPAVSWQDVQEVPGQGVEGFDELGRRWRLGRGAWAGAPDEGVARGDTPHAWLVGPAGPVARFVFDEQLREDAAHAVAALLRQGVDVRLASGDRREVALAMARQLGIEAVRGAASPQDKLDEVRCRQALGHRVAMVGDGVNDAPVLAQADVSMAMGLASDLARSRADLHLLSGRVSDVIMARDVAQRTMSVIRQNLAWAAAYNVVALPLALAGWIPPWLAGLGMAGSSLLVVANALRLQRVPAQHGAP